MKGGGSIKRGLSLGRCLLGVLGPKIFKERGRVMAKRVLLVCLLGFGLIALIGNEALAVCYVRNADGKCLFGTGSILAQINENGLGNVSKNPAYFLFDATTGETPWVLACGNHGSKKNVAPGVNLVYYNETISAQVQILKADVDKNGAAIKTVVGEPDLTYFNTLSGVICPNPNWSVVNAVPCHMDEVIDKVWQYVQGGIHDGELCETATATFTDCNLPNCETLGIDRVTGHFEYREYNCQEPVINNYDPGNYKCPPPGYTP
jgi:hypothetical protein